MITRVVIEHFKSIDRLELDLGRLVLLVGPNGSGKSNFVDALRFVRDAVQYGLDRAVSERHGIDSVRQWSPSKPYHISIRLDLMNEMGSGHFAVTLASARGAHVVRREEGSWLYHHENARGAANYSRGPDGQVIIQSRDDELKVQAEQAEELFLSQLEARWLRPLLYALANFEAYSIYPNVIRTPQKSSSDTRLSSSGENLTSIFRQITKSKRQDHVKARNEIVASIRHVMPALDNIRIQSLGGLMVPVFRVREPNGKLHDFNVAQLSDGTLRLLGLLTALYQPRRPDVLAMEEPEQTVNPGILAVIAEAIQETALESQVVVTTHSPELLDKFPDPGVVFAVEMDGGVSRIGPVSPTQVKAVRERLFSLGELMTIEGLHR